MSLATDATGIETFECNVSSPVLWFDHPYPLAMLAGDGNVTQQIRSKKSRQTFEKENSHRQPHKTQKRSIEKMRRFVFCSLGDLIPASAPHTTISQLLSENEPWQRSEYRPGEFSAVRESSNKPFLAGFHLPLFSQTGLTSPVSSCGVR